MSRRERAAVLSERELVAIAKRAIVEVDVLAELLATAIRSNAPATPATKRLEAAVEDLPRRFGALMAPLVGPAAPRRTRQARR